MKIAPQTNRYILCRYEPMIGNPLKTNKIPLHPKTLHAHSPLDTTIHMDYVTAKQQAMLLGDTYGIGFVFMAEDKYFFIDIDNCLQPDNSWSQLAIDAVGQFPQAFVEVSHSGRGLHIIGRYHGDEPVHACKAADLGIEIYTSSRFCALTEDRAVGDAGTIHTDALNGFIARCGLAQAPNRSHNEEWTTESKPGCNPPEDNTTLLEFILSKAATGPEAFGKVVAFKDLWENNGSVLAKWYPSQIEGKEYDYSSADMALAMRLHYFVGGNCERVSELMKLSRLARDKWDSNPDYLPRTILKARGGKQEHYVFMKAHHTPHQNNTATSEQGQHNLGDILTVEQQIQYFQGCTYVAEVNQILTPEGLLYKSEAFNAMYGGCSMQMDRMNMKITDKPFEAFTRSKAHVFPKVHTTTFKPSLPFGTIQNEDKISSVNTYCPVFPPRLQGDIKPFLDQVAKLIPDTTDRLILISYMAAVVQHPGVKFTWCPLIQGVQGNGKTLLMKCIAYCIGQRYTHLPKSAELGSKFNGWMYGKMFIGVDDIFISADELMEIIKPMITSDRQEIEIKGQEKITREICCNFWLNTNHKDGVRKTSNERRFAHFYTAQQEKQDLLRDGMTAEYFNYFRHWLYNRNGFAIVAEYLHTFVIPDIYNPATLCTTAPETSSSSQALDQGRDAFEQEIVELCAQGVPGFKKGWVSMSMLGRWMDNSRRFSKITLNRRSEVLKKLGYIPHPSLPENGRVHSPVNPDGLRTRLYVRLDHPSLTLTNKTEIAKLYESDQTATG